MKKFYFILRNVKTGQEYYKTIHTKTLAEAVQLCKAYYPSFVQVSVKEVE